MQTNKISHQNPKGADNMATKQDKKQVKISKIEITKDKRVGSRRFVFPFTRGRKHRILFVF